MKTLLMTLIFSISAHSALKASEVKLIYSTVSKHYCAMVSDAASDSEGEYDFVKRECPSFGGYRVFIEGSDLRYGLHLYKKNKKIDLPVLDSFHLPGSKVIEWRYTVDGEKIQYHGLLFRIEHSTGIPNTMDSVIFAIRLNGKKSCVVGQYKESEFAHLGKGAETTQARKLIDNPRIRCK